MPATMTANHSNAFLLSATLHGAVLALVLVFTYVVHRQVKGPEKVFELVAGEGDNFAATVAPGRTGTRPAPRAPLTPAQKLRRDYMVADNKAKIAIQKEREAEEKRLAQLEAEQKKQAKTQPPAKIDPAKLPKLNPDDIVKGVPGGSLDVKEGAGGNRLTRSDEDSALDLYFAMLKERLLRAIAKPSGVSDTLVTEAEFRLNADGSITGARIIKRSGSPEFDNAVLEAFAHTRMPARPDGRSETHKLEFRTRDAEER
jgi:colicin import membrane protein